MRKKRFFNFVCVFLFLATVIGLPVLSQNAVASRVKKNKHCNISKSIYPDLVLLNGNIITVDSDFSFAQAIAVKSGRIVAVGTNREIRKIIGESTKVINLKGATVLPGINDAHNHLNGFGLSRPPLVLDVAYPSVKSIADVAAMIQERAGEVEPGEWIQGQGWDVGFFSECVADPSREPTRWDLDPASPDNPVALTDFSAHVCWANSKALELAGITADTPNPHGGVIVKDSTGQPTGILKESAAGLVRRLIPPWTDEQRREGIIRGMQELNTLGITSATEPGLGASMIRMYSDLYKNGDFTVRMNLMISVGNSLEKVKDALSYIGTNTGFGDEWLQIAGIKLFGDGIPPSRTGYMWEDYLDYPDGSPGGHGELQMEGDTEQEREDMLKNMIKYASARGFQIGIHATGDRAIDTCVDGYIEALNEHPWDARHYIIHGDYTGYTHPDTFERMAQYGIQINVQSAIKWTIGNLMIGIVGEEKAAYQWPLRSMLDAGLIVTDSSDATVTYPDWRQGVESAVLREDKATGNVSGAEQCITVKEAIEMYTINGAWQDHQEDIKGSIEAGKLADFTIIGDNILSVDPHAISDIPIMMTIVGGEVVYDAGLGL